MSKFNEIKKTFEDAVSTSSWWSRHIGSQFVDYLVLFVTKIVERVETASSRALQESFLSLATTRSAILAGAEERGYVGRKAMPSKGKAMVVNSTDARIAFPSLTQCIAANQQRYTIMNGVDLAAGESAEVEVQQFEILKFSHEVTETTSWMSIVFPKTLTTKIHNIIVRVDGVEWTNTYKFRDTNRDSLAYMEYYKSSDQYGVRFGNGSNGKIPQVGSVIEFELWLTNGVTTLMGDQALTLIDSEDFAASQIKASIKTTTSIMGGAEPEDIESIRNAALYSPIYDEQIAWDGDYKTFIKRNVSGITWLNVWGEQAQEKLTGVRDLNNINTIFISAYSPDKDDETLWSEIYSLFEKREGYNEEYRKVERKPLPFTVNVSGVVARGKDPESAVRIVTESLNALFGEDAAQSETIHSHQVWRSVESLSFDLGINHFTVDCIGLTADIPIDTHHFLDLSQSQINFTFQEEN